MDAIFFIGPQGSGKGTQAKILAERLGFFYWEMGGIVRQLAKDNTPLGQKVKNLNEKGVLLSDELIFDIARDRLEALPKDQGIIFDGLPRRVRQAEFLLEFLKQQNRSRIVTLLIDLPREESINRLLLRAQKEARKDDTREGIEFRLKQYEEDTLPMLEYLRKKSEFIAIDGKPAVPEVTASINKALELT